MKNRTSFALAAAMLLAGVTAASAATMSNSAKASDTLSLTSTQQKTAWRDLFTPSLNQTTPSGFDATVGAVVPNSVATAPVSSKAAHAVPALKPYDFAMIQKKLVIVNPSDKKIAEVITG
jgi:ABC-type transport system substrate-binding protein